MIMLMDKKRTLNQILGPDPKEMKPEGAPTPSELHSCVDELISAVHEKDVEGALSALRAIFLELKTEPNEEG